VVTTISWGGFGRRSIALGDAGGAHRQRSGTGEGVDARRGQHTRFYRPYITTHGRGLDAGQPVAWPRVFAGDLGGYLRLRSGRDRHRRGGRRGAALVHIPAIQVDSCGTRTGLNTSFWRGGPTTSVVIESFRMIAAAGKADPVESARASEQGAARPRGPRPCGATAGGAPFAPVGRGVALLIAVGSYLAEVAESKFQGGWITRASDRRAVDCGTWSTPTPEGTDRGRRQFRHQRRAVGRSRSRMGRSSSQFKNYRVCDERSAHDRGHLVRNLEPGGLASGDVDHGPPRPNAVSRRLEADPELPLAAQLLRPELPRNRAIPTFQ